MTTSPLERSLFYLQSFLLNPSNTIERARGGLGHITTDGSSPPWLRDLGHDHRWLLAGSTQATIAGQSLPCGFQTLSRTAATSPHSPRRPMTRSSQ